MNCAWCNTSINDKTPTGYKLSEDAPEIPALCISCWEKAAVCNTCNGVFEYPKNIMYTGRDGRYMCNSCATDLETCEDCGKKKPHLKDVFGKKRCISCAKKYYYCGGCKEWHTLTAVPCMDTSDDLHLEYPYLWAEYKSFTICRTFFLNSITPRMQKKRVFSCTHCMDKSSHVFKREGVTYDLCQRCAKTTKKCTHCGIWHPEVSSYGGTLLCYTCKRTHYRPCTCCNKLRKKVECKNYFCTDCRKTHLLCANCDRYHPIADHQEFNGQLLCNYCFNNLRTCKVCKKKALSHYASNMCRSCALSVGCGKIEPYTLKPTPVFHGKGTLHYGFENEVSFSSEVSLKGKVAEVLKNFEENELIVKSDSSIDYGFEVVSHPHTFEKYQDKKWKDMFVSEMRNSDSCGMHVHVNLESFTSFHLYKFVSFIHKHPTLMTKISERSPNHYCQLYSESNMAPVIKKFKKDGEKSDRYRRVNLGSKTIELRCFAGVTTYERWMKNIEFIRALYEYTLNTGNLDLNPRTWKLFVVKNKKMYPNLNTFMCSLYSMPSGE